jgi:hypothetical protein
MDGELVVPAPSRGIVIVAAGAGRITRSSPASRAMIELVRERAEVATLLFDLLSAPEQVGDPDTASLRLEVSLLAQRLAAVTDFVLSDDGSRHLPIGYLASGAGAAAALHVASSRSDVRAIVSRSGHPELAGAALEAVRAPTLLLVDEGDDVALALNRSARARLPAKSDLTTVRASTDEDARRAAEWFAKHLG